VGTQIELAKLRPAFRTMLMTKIPMSKVINTLDKRLDSEDEAIIGRTLFQRARPTPKPSLEVLVQRSPLHRSIHRAMRVASLADSSRSNVPHLVA
jgi:hypothetical protein